MNEWTTAFEITRDSNGVRAGAVFDFVIGVAAISAGLVVLLFAVRRRKDFFKSLWFPVLMIGWGVAWLVSGQPEWRIAFSDLPEMLRVYRSGKCEITEGVVHVTHQQPAHGHSEGDRITIGDKQFEINYFLFTPGYKQTIAHGGALSEGVFARLRHHHGVILKVEVMRK